MMCAIVWGLLIANIQKPTRFILDYGADDITNFYHHLLTRISFPYKELDIKTPQGWEFMDEQKRLTNSLVDVSLSHPVSLVEKEDKLSCLALI